MRSRPLAAAAWLAACCLGPAAASAAKPTVEVEFACREPVYCSNFLDAEGRPNSEGRDLAATLASQLRAMLQQRFRYFDFVESGGAHRLVVALERSSGSADLAEIDDVVLRLYFEEDGADGAPAWPFRGRSEYTLDVGERPVFGRRLCERFAAHLQDAARQQHLVGEVLGRVPLADRAWPMANLSWALPFTRDETGIGYGSKLTIETLAKDSSARVVKKYLVEARGETTEDAELPLEYRAKLLAETEQPKGPWKVMPQATGIFIVEQQRPRGDGLRRSPGTSTARRQGDCSP
jgi:hypothetical protein